MTLRVYFPLIAALICATTYGQNTLASYAAQLRTPDTATGAQTIVSNDASISPGLKDAAPIEKVSGYRVCIFFDNTQGARTAAAEAEAKFKAKFPGIPSAVIYPNPTFKVMVGNCLTKAEATILRGRVKDQFPQSTIVNENIPLTTFILDPTAQIVEMSDSTATAVTAIAVTAIGEPALD